MLEPKCNHASDDLLGEGLPWRLWRFAVPLRSGLLPFQRTGETYSFKVTGLGELIHDDLTTVR